MSGYLLNAIEDNPSDALIIFTEALKDFKKNFTYNPIMKKINYCSNCRLYTKAYGYKIVEVILDDIEEQIVNAIKYEIDNNFQQFLEFLTDTQRYTYRISHRFKNCYFAIQTMGELHSLALNDFSFLIHKNKRDTENFSGFYVCELNPLIDYSGLIDEAKIIIESPVKEDNLCIYADALAIIIGYATQYSSNPITFEECAKLLEFSINSLNTIPNCGIADCEAYESLSSVYIKIIKLYIKMNMLKPAEAVLEHFTQFNLQSYFHFFICDEKYARQFYFNMVEIAKTYNNRPSVIEFARTCFEYIDSLEKPRHIYQLQEFMIKQIESKQDIDEPCLDLIVCTLEFMLHFVVTLMHSWSTGAIDFVNKQLKYYENSPDDLIVVARTFSVRISMFNKRFFDKYPDLVELDKKLSKLYCGLLNKYDEDYGYPNHDYPIDINGNIFNMVNPKKPWIDA